VGEGKRRRRRSDKTVRDHGGRHQSPDWIGQQQRYRLKRTRPPLGRLRRGLRVL